MNRRTAGLALLVLGAVTLGSGAHAASKIRRIGYLTTGSSAAGFQNALLQALRELGWTEGQNLVVEYRFADGNFNRLPALAAELVSSNVELIVAAPTPAAVAASRATQTIPVVMSNAADPVALGLVRSLARPGGNVTGTAWSVGLETLVKSLELLKEALPNVRHVAVLSNPANPSQVLAVKNLQASAQSLRLNLLLVEARGPDEFDGVFARLDRERVDALLVLAESLFLLHSRALADLALKHRLPTMHGITDNVTAGGLMSYGPNLNDNTRQAARFVDKILRGAKPAELPVQQPTKFELVVNLKTARTLGIVIPQAVLARANEVIE
jgi:putative ABC transport system substrate-binding protein